MNERNQFLVTFLVACLLIGSGFVIAQMEDDDRDENLENCEWTFQADPIAVAAAAGGGGGGGGGGQSSFNSSPAFPVARTVNAYSPHGYLLDECTGSMYRVVRDSETGTATGHRVILND